MDSKDRVECIQRLEIDGRESRTAHNSLGTRVADRGLGLFRSRARHLRCTAETLVTTCDSPGPLDSVSRQSRCTFLSLFNVPHLHFHHAVLRTTPHGVRRAALACHNHQEVCPHYLVQPTLFITLPKARGNDLAARGPRVARDVLPPAVRAGLCRCTCTCKCQCERGADARPASSPPCAACACAGVCGPPEEHHRLR